MCKVAYKKYLCGCIGGIAATLQCAWDHDTKKIKEENREPGYICIYHNRLLQNEKNCREGSLIEYWNMGHRCEECRSNNVSIEGEGYN